MPFLENSFLRRFWPKEITDRRRGNGSSTLGLQDSPLLMGRGNSERVMVRSDPFTMADTVLNFGEMLVYIGHCEGARAAPTARPTAPITLMGNDKVPVRWVSPSGQ